MKHIPKSRFPIFAFVAALLTLNSLFADQTIEDLRCEYLDNPRGIDALKPRLSWVLKSDERGQKQTAYQVLVASTPAILTKDQGDLWDSGKVNSDQSIQVGYAGKPLDSRMDCHWKVRVWDKNGRTSDWSAPANWTMGLLKASDWQARWIAHAAPSTGPATMVRKEFEVGGPIKRATVSVTGLGLYELRINGQRVGDHLLAPEWTRYSKTIQYQTYDVTDLVKNGKNAVGAQIGGGWWTTGIMAYPSVLNPQFCLLMRMDIELADGSRTTVVSDPSWLATTEGPIRHSSIYFGETYDATKEMPGWDQPGFDACGWMPVKVLPFPSEGENAVLRAQCNEPIRVVKELRPVRITEPKPGVYVFDMGQNMVGWCRLKVTAPAGTKVTLRHVEVLYEDGTINTDSLWSMPAQMNEYTLREGESVLEPHFTYHGFRYVEVTGLPAPPTKDTLLGRVFHSSAPDVGEFSCSNELVNKVMQCVKWTQHGNMMSVPTDCPQRCERAGWMGDIQAFSQTSIFEMNMAAFFTKWMRDISDSQADDGRYSDYAPRVSDPNGQEKSGSPAWADAGLIVPWRMYQNYADMRVLEQQYESARRWIEYVLANNPNLLWVKNAGQNYGDWLNGDLGGVVAGYPHGISAIPNDVFATAFFAHSSQLLGKMAKLLGRQDDAVKYARLFEEIKAVFNREFVASDGRIKGDTQAGYALALHMNLLDAPLREKAMTHLLDAIQKYQGHLSTGIHTTHRMMLELTRNGRHDEAWRLMNLHTMPSWGGMLALGGTTIWESWNAYNPGTEKIKTAKSFNHCAFGSVGEWVWRDLAGINPDEEQPGYKHFLIRPRPCGDLARVRARYDSIHGPIVSEWKIEEGRFHLRVKIPPNTTADIFIPAKNVADVTEGSTLASKATGIRSATLNGADAVFAVESGDYTFAAPVSADANVRGIPTTGHPQP